MKEKRIQQVFKGLKEVFRQPKYLVLSIVIAVVFFAINVLLPNIKTLVNMLTAAGLVAAGRFALVLLKGGFGSMTVLSAFLLVTIACLLGIVISLITYKIKVNKVFSMQGGKATTIGAVLGVAAPGCASCGIGVLSVLGLTGSLAVLPFKGAEIGLLSVALLLTATASLAMRIAEGNTCRIDFKKKQR